MESQEIKHIYEKGQYYEDLGVYLGIRSTYKNKIVRKEHLFRYGRKECGTAQLNRILILFKFYTWI